MKKQFRLLMTCLFVALSSGALVADAQVASGGPFTLDQSVVANGGGLSADAGNTYKLEGTAAQHAAGTFTRQSPFSQMGGFWPATLPNTPTAAPAAISGRITTNDGFPVAGVLLTLTGSGQARAITDSNGVYAFSTVEVGGFYTVIPSRANYTFAPSNKSFSLVADKTDAVFAAAPDAVPTANPLDTPEYFVRQQYLDMLGREPDDAGLMYWSDQLLACGSDAVCANTQRRDVAAAFFIEQEAQQTGSYIYEVYAGALGRRPLFNEYQLDRQQVIGGPALDTEKTAFAQSFVRRPEFTAKYQSSTTAESFVDALLQSVQQSPGGDAASTGIDLSSQRDTLIAAYHNGGNMDQSRALVLRKIADNPTFKQSQYNAAFVLTEYFAYLQRDAEPGGYNFWLNILNNSGGVDAGNYRGMVCSFITSAEYQRRFSSIVSHSNGQCGRH